MSRSGQENEAIFKQLRDWLARTADEISALGPSETDASKKEGMVEDDTRLESCAEFASGPAAWAAYATRFDETIRLEKTEGSDEPVANSGTEKSGRLDETTEMEAGLLGDGLAARLPEIGLRQFVEAFTAMRHESKLQTKSTRTLEKSVQKSLAGLDTAIHQLETGQPQAQDAAEQAAAVVESLVELDEALLRGARAFDATHRRLTQTAPKRLQESLDATFRSLPRWRRWAARRWHQQMQRACADSLERINAEEFAHLMEGNMMIRARIELALRTHGIARIQSVGRRVDPAEMTVVELVDSPGTEPETVVSEVRPGYKWRDQVIRFAEVRAVDSRRESPPADVELKDAHPEVTQRPTTRLRVH